MQCRKLQFLWQRHSEMSDLPSAPMKIVRNAGIQRNEEQWFQFTRLTRKRNEFVNIRIRFRHYFFDDLQARNS